MPRAVTHRSAADLVAAGLAPPRRSAELERVAARYAVALTPETGRAHRPRRPARSHCASVRSGCGRARPAGRQVGRPDRRRCAQPDRRHRAPLSRPRAAQARLCLCGLLPVLLSARNGGARPPARAFGAALAAALAYIRDHPEIWEVILTGGDPLILSARRLRARDGGAGCGSITSRWCVSIPACRSRLPP